MSAHIVNKLHIDALVLGAIDRPAGIAPNRCDGHALRFDLAGKGYIEYLGADDADALGQMLVDANLSSVLERYPDCESDHSNIPGPLDAYYMKPYRFERPPAHLTALELLMAFASYEYQASESENWATSQAFEFCQAMQNHLVRRIPGYSDGPWAVTSEYYLRRRAA